MICTKEDSYIYNLCHVELMISWEVVLTDGTSVFGDYDRPGMSNPWTRLTEHCHANDVYPAKIKLYMFGAEPKVFFEDPNGLDGIVIMRGVGKDQAMEGGHSRSFQTLTVMHLRDDCSVVDVSKYTWPHNDFEQKESERILTTENLQNMIFKNDSEKRQRIKVKRLLDGSIV